MSDREPSVRQFRYHTHCPACERDISTLAKSGSSNPGVWIRCFTCQELRYARRNAREETQEVPVSL